MKTLYNTIQESLLGNVDNTLSKLENNALLAQLFSNNLDERHAAFDKLRLLVESHRPKRHMTTNKMKNSDSYFIEFTWPLKIENGLARDICDWISYIQIYKRTEISYRTVCINASEDIGGNKINVFTLNWPYTQANFNPKASNTKLYEVPEDLNDLFERIQEEAYNHR